MESVVPSGAGSLTEEADTLLTVVDEDFENIYDVPFVTVNRIDDEIHAEIILSGIDEVDEDRLNTAQSVAREHGFRSYARVFADLYEDGDACLMYFTNDPAKGLIWALENEGDWYQ